MSQPTAEIRLEPTRSIPPPNPDREPMKVNVYERMAKAGAQLVSLFPYDDAGSIVPCGSIMIGGPGHKFGHFFHQNSVSEVVLAYGANNAMLSPGQIHITQPIHGVNSFLRDDEDPDAYLVVTITQHQAETGDQTEAMIARCKNCKAEIVRHEYDATPAGLPGFDPTQLGHADDVVRQFATTVGSATFAELRNTENGRSCAACGHVNDEFPPEHWGWSRQVAQTTTANNAYRSMREAGGQP